MMETIPSGTILHRHYRVERVLGSGGFGHVYLAVDLQTNQQFAIKEYLVSGASGQAQLQHEANVLSHLHHPNLPAFREAFSERGHYYVVLSYIEGNDLTDIIRMARQRNDVIPLPRIMHWLLSVCDAVMFLHNQQPPVIHRDIKPDNIRITSEGIAILVDLGNAKATADGARTLFFIRHQGTPGYAPQEQYPGGSGTTVRSDVYALGATLYFALTAHEPPSVSTRNQSIQQHLPDLPSLRDQLLNNPPEDSPEANAQRQFRLGVSKPARPAPRHIRHLAQLATLPPLLLDQLNTIIVRAMAMNQKDRYRSVADLSNDLFQVMNAINALAPATQTASPRPLDPNSTQPDLPQLYEALQSAKLAQSAQSPRPAQTAQPDQTIPAPVQPARLPAQSHTCPRCGKQVVSEAAFCPFCGASISRNAAPNSPTDSTQPPVSNGPSLLHNNVPASQGNNQFGDQPQQQMQLRLSPSAVPSTPASPPSGASKAASRPVVTLPPVQHRTISSPVQVSGVPETNGHLHIPSQKPPVSSVQPSRPVRTGNQIMLIAIIALVVLLIIAILVFLLLRHSASAQTLPSVPLTLVTQVVSHEQPSFFTDTTLTTLVTPGLWTCGAGMSSSFGLA